jgi:gas vesicle protein
MQTQAFNMMREQSEKISAAFRNTSQSGNGPYSNWAKAAFQAFPDGEDGNLAKDTFGKTLYGTEAMQKLYEFWLPLAKAIGDKAVDPTTYATLFDPAKSKEFYNTLFNLQPDSLSKLQQQLSQYSDLYQQSVRSWTEAAQSGAERLAKEGAIEGAISPDSMMKQMQSVYALLDTAAGKLISIPALGKDRENLELLARCSKSMSEFVARSIEYQQMMQETGAEAMQATVKGVSKKVKAREKFEDFDDFFSLWIDTSEKSFNKLFRSKVFSQRRNAMTDAGFNTRKLYNQIIENNLADLPVARRSEMDEIYKIIYDLRKKVKKLEAQVHDSAKSK